MNDEALVEDTPHTIGVLIGQKRLRYHSGEETGYTLVPVVVRGGGYSREWKGNFIIGSEGESEGFRIAADKLYAELSDYLDRYELAEKAEEGDVKFWPVGYSRGGGAANQNSQFLKSVISGEFSVGVGETSGTLAGDFGQDLDYRFFLLQGGTYAPLAPTVNAAVDKD